MGPTLAPLAPVLLMAPRPTHLKTEGLSTTEVGSSRKWFCLMKPVRVLTVTTGKPICSVQRSMMLLMDWGSETLFSVTACREGSTMGHQCQRVRVGCKAQPVLHLSPSAQQLCGEDPVPPAAPQSQGSGGEGAGLGGAAGSSQPPPTFCK